MLDLDISTYVSGGVGCDRKTQPLEWTGTNQIHGKIYKPDAHFNLHWDVQLLGKANTHIHLVVFCLSVGVFISTDRQIVIKDSLVSLDTEKEEWVGWSSCSWVIL